MTTAAVTAGLTTEQAAARLAEVGPNRIPQAATRAFWRRLVLQLRDPLILVLLFAAALTIATGDHPDAAIIAIVIVANTAVGLGQEIKADNAIAALRDMTAPVAHVLRDGRPVTIDAEAVVPGDAMLLAEGDVVPADGTLLDAAALRVDESALTGESVPADKDLGGGEASGLSAGTVVVHGRAVAEVTRTGASSAMGRIASALAVAPTLTPLQRRLAHLGRVLAAVAGVFCVVVMIVGLARGEPAELMVVTAVSLVVAAVPESLPAVVTLGLALGARRMATRHAVVRRLPAVETLGSVTVIATDKTGTVTEGTMVAELIWTPATSATVTGGGFSPVGEVLTDDGPISGSTAPDIVRLLTAAVLCNDATLQPPSGPDRGWTAVGDPTEAALVAAAAKVPMDVDGVRAAHPRVHEVPFDSDSKRMTTVHAARAGRLLVATKGAPEAVLRPDVVDATPPELAAARAEAEAYAECGYRVLAIAAAEVAGAPTPASAAARPLRLAGLVAMADPPRPAAAATVAACRAAGITPVLVTGDHVATARNIAERVGIIAGDELAVTGRETVGGAPDPRVVRVIARTDPDHKLQLVAGWQRAGHVVAMTGDGVNDGPALRQADIGVAMGRRGTDIARQAADIVLTDDDLATVVAAVEEGRRVYANVRRFLLYALAGGAAELLVMLIGPGVGLALPLLPAQILWINLLTHGLPGVAMGAEPVDPGVMQQPPRPPAESVIGDGLWPRILGVAAAVTACSLAAGLWAHAAGQPWQSVLFLTLGMGQFGVALGVRARPGSTDNAFLLAAVAVAFVLQLAGVYVPLLRELLETEPVHPLVAAGTVGAAVVGFAAARISRRSRSRGGTLASGGSPVTG